MNHTPPEKPLRVWRITRVKGQYLGRVQAADATAAIEAAVKLFKVAKMHRSRLLAEPVGEIRNVSNREVVQVAALQLKLDRSQATAQERADFDAALARMSHAELMALSLAAKLLDGRSQYMRLSGEWAERTRAVARLIGATEESQPDGGVVYHPRARQ
jgi:hypothetical protein